MLVEEMEPRRLLATNGLSAVYYNNLDFTGTTYQRTDANVNLQVGNGSPVPGVIGPDTFSVRWTGTVEPQHTQTYTFYTQSNNGVRLWVNGKLVINNWIEHNLVENRGSIALVAGKRYDLRMEFYDNTGIATATLSWSSASVPKQLVPTARLHRYDVRLAVIGDYGFDGPDEAAVAKRVKSWTPDFIITTGDNNYVLGEAATIDANVGKHYREYISPYKGTYGPGAKDGVNRFFPSLGNHDLYTPGGGPYLDYFTLPGNERYYDFAHGPLHLFALNSDVTEPDGNLPGSVQAHWVEARLADSTAPWQLVYFHHAPYSSGPHGSDTNLQWDFKRMGADAVLTGHDHIYERVHQGGLPYFVNGLGGHSRYGLIEPVAGSQVRYNADFGAMLVQANDKNLTFQFMTRGGTLIDSYTLTAPPPAVALGPDVPAGPEVPGPALPGGAALAQRAADTSEAGPKKGRAARARGTGGGSRSTTGFARTPSPRAPAVIQFRRRTA